MKPRRSLNSPLSSWSDTRKSSPTKNGALAYSQYLDEAIIEHEVAGNDDVVQILQELKRTAFGIYLRIKRGDDELLGDRDGKYSGYYDEA